MTEDANAVPHSAGADPSPSGAGSDSSPPRPWVAIVLGLAVAASLGINATLEDPHGSWVPVYEELAPHLGEGSLGFVSDAPADTRKYRYRMARYALAPRQLDLVGRRTAHDWVVSDLVGPLPGYDVVHRVGDDVMLLRRR